MQNKRPVNLDLTTIQFPPTAIVSILHRLSGLLVFLLIPLLLWMLHCSLASADDFANLTQHLASPLTKFFVWVFISGLLYHLIAGIRHLLMDMHIGEELKSGRLGSYLVLIISFILIIIAGVYIW